MGEKYINQKEAAGFFREARKRLLRDFPKANDFHTRDTMLLNAEQFIEMMPVIEIDQKNEVNKMITPENLTLTEKVKLYATGNKEEELPAHAFDFSYEDADNIMSALRIVWLLSRVDIVHNYQAEREDIKKFCIEANGVIRIAKRLIEKCPIKAQFRLRGGNEDAPE